MASRREAFDALVASVKGTSLEGVIARYAAERGYTPEDPVWDTAAPVLIAGAALQEKIAQLPDLGAAVKAGAAEGIAEAAPAISQHVSSTAANAVATETANAVRRVADTAGKKIGEFEIAARQRLEAVTATKIGWAAVMPMVAIAVIVVAIAIALAFGVGQKQGFSAGYAAAVRQVHHR